MKRTLSERPLAIHGTSREAVDFLFKEGVLPAKGHKGYEEWFYFTPVSRYYDNSPFALRTGKFTLSQAMSSAKFYAQLYSWEMFLEKRLGKVPAWWGDQVDTVANHCRFFEEEFDKKRGDEEVREFVERMWKRRGYVLEPSTLLFERYHYRRGDDSKVIAFRCPDGLPLECLKAIVPLGKEERKILLG
jgi:hypothetical protein